MDLPTLEQILGVTFANQDLLRTALVHRSYLNENPKFNLPSNERLEFLGDAVLELIVSDHLYKTYPESPEGELTNYRSSLVNTSSLAESSLKLGVGEFLFLSKGEEGGGGRKNQYILANTFEALLGAIYLDRGYEAASKFVHSNLIVKLSTIIEQQLYKDAKSSLQELAQDEISVTPTYRVLSETGPDHNKQFTVGVYAGAKLLGKGTGRSKQQAEQQAAALALANWDNS
jgi:ribonuclease III